MERLMDVAASLVANNVNTNSISHLRELLQGLHNRLLDNFNQVPPLLSFTADLAIVNAS